MFVVRSELRFRTLAGITDSLIAAGFVIERLYRDWQRGPLRNSSRVMVLVARRAALPDG
jgi:hypothetical protein